MDKTRPNLEKATLQTPNLLKERLKEAKRLLPEAFSEGRLDVDKLKKALGDTADDRPERYTFSWAGKRDAIRLLQIPAQGTLVPDKAQSEAFDTTENMIIEGDNLEVLKLLYKSYFGKVKMIYIDPPYNTGNDFVYPDNYTDPLGSYLAITGQKDDDGNLLTSNPESNGRFHSSWLSMMYPRLFVARQLLRDDGLIFVSIDDNEVHDLKMILNEAFGEENFIAQLVWENREGGGGSDSIYFKVKHEYLLVYARNIEIAEIKGIGITNEDRYTESDEHEKTRGKHLLIKLNSASIQYSKSLDYPITAPDGATILPSYGNKQACWRWGKCRVVRHMS
jgi:adenine-specific DNA-methyltransferase